jgi:hypothetical protein
VQALGEAHDTALSAVYPVRLTFGVRWIVHRRPFQRSASVHWPAADAPTAVHAVDEVHDTPRNWLCREGVAVRTIRHRDPFQVSASGLSRNAGEGRAPAPRV